MYDQAHKFESKTKNVKAGVFDATLHFPLTAEHLLIFSFLLKLCVSI